MKETIFFNVFGTMHNSVTNLLSRPMFLWSRNKIKAWRLCLYTYSFIYTRIIPRAKMHQGTNMRANPPKTLYYREFIGSPYWQMD